MRKSAKIIQINGLRGLLVAIFFAICLCAGFVVFPGYVAMKLWNHFVTTVQINLFQGILLWIMATIVYFIATKQSFAISFGRPKELNEEEMNELVNRIRMQTKAKAVNQILLKNIEDFENIENKTADTVNEETNEGTLKK